MKWNIEDILFFALLALIAFVGISLGLILTGVVRVANKLAQLVISALNSWQNSFLAVGVVIILSWAISLGYFSWMTQNWIINYLVFTTLMAFVGLQGQSLSIINDSFWQGYEQAKQKQKRSSLLVNTVKRNPAEWEAILKRLQDGQVNTDVFFSEEELKQDSL